MDGQDVHVGPSPRVVEGIEGYVVPSPRGPDIADRYLEVGPRGEETPDTYLEIVGEPQPDYPKTPHKDGGFMQLTGTYWYKAEGRQSGEAIELQPFGTDDAIDAHSETLLIGARLDESKLVSNYVHNSYSMSYFQCLITIVKIMGYSQYYTLD